MNVRVIADKYISNGGGLPQPVKPATLLTSKEASWLKRAVQRGGWFPYRLPGDNDGPFPSELKSLQQRGLINGPPWQIAKLGRETLARGIVVGDQIFVPPSPDFSIRTLAEVEREHILSVLHQCGGNRTHAAKALGICIRTMRNKMHALMANSGKRQDG